MPRGFILDPAYRMEHGRAVVHLWGVLETGESFLVRDRRVAPHFYIRSEDVDRAQAAASVRGEATSLRGMAGEPVERVTLASPQDARAVRERLEAAGLRTYEGDLRLAMSYLMDRGIRGALSIEGRHSHRDGVARVYDDPEIAPAELAPDLRVLSLDIETDPTASRILSVALHAEGVAEVIVVAGGGGVMPAIAREARDERELLAAFAQRVREIDPDVLTGWNLVGFDLTVLERRARELDVPFALGRGGGALRITTARSPWGSARAQVDGRVVLDGIELMRGAFMRMDSYRLDAVARVTLGEGKTLSAPGRPEEIERLWRDDLAAFCAYNLKDAELVTRILEKTGLVRLAVTRSLLTGMPLDRVSASIASFDALYLPALHARGIVAPTLRSGADGELEPAEATAGGAVLSPVPGLHERVLVFDFKSLYPSLMCTFNIDPLTHVREPAADADLIRTPSGACFRREPGIVPALLARLLAVRADATRRGDATASHATKILMSSFYGVLATPACRFYSSAVANAITHSGQALLYWTKARVEEMGHRVLYGDTDSLFVESRAGDDASARAAGGLLARRLNDDLRVHLRREHDVESHLELEFEELYSKLFFPHVRGGSEGARKRYAGLVVEGERREVVFVGMESVRRDATEAAKEFQRGLYERVFANEPVEGFVREFVRTLREGLRDPQLVYRKSLRKPAEDYTATTPPHVKAARLEGTAGRGLVEYVMTLAGPEPLSAREHALDHEHYVEKQLRPVAEPLLELLHLEWDDLIGRPRQLGLF
jgi:DNA polymerase-2